MSVVCRICLIVAIVVISGLFMSAPAEAQVGFGAGYPYYDGLYPAFYRRGIVDQVPPYFSMFPPVYYHHPVISRPYGWSPFAVRGSEFDTMPTAAPQPKMIENPHFKKDAAAEASDKPDDQKTASVTPKVIYNPYVVSDTPVLVATQSADK